MGSKEGRRCPFRTFLEAKQMKTTTSWSKSSFPVMDVLRLAPPDTLKGQRSHAAKLKAQHEGIKGGSLSKAGSVCCFEETGGFFCCC